MPGGYSFVKFREKLAKRVADIPEFRRKLPNSPLNFLLPDLLGMAPQWLGRTLKRTGMPVPFTAPRTSFNRTITSLRSVAYTSLRLDDVKLVKNAFGVKVNDVVLAVCAGALRRYLEARGELPDEPLVATVPVSV